jgi:hypothetical protein
MNDELRAAAEQILAGEVVQVNDDGSKIAKMMPQSWQELARAWLAENDDTAISETWLQLAGSKFREDWLAWQLPSEDQCVLIWRSNGESNVWTMQYENTFSWPHDLRTLGELRILCKALGVSVKEPTGGA